MSNQMINNMSSAIPLEASVLPVPPLSAVSVLFPKLHRVSEVRRMQNISLAVVAQQLGISVVEAREQEQPDSDMTIAQLRRWQECLGVPIAELLIDLDEYPDNPIRRRGELVRVMKSAKTILERSKESSTKIMAQNLVDQLIEIMPELAFITSWPSVGQSREPKDIGLAGKYRFDPNIAKMLENGQ
ncbi:MAG: hypothetical protein LBU65_02645 [Planctomycetaceae bacterium]|jgi:transcriptional regulator with XRE-family HTH domain|nr:hypothetical protein [Planctomycetaceae bacterium]